MNLFHRKKMKTGNRRKIRGRLLVLEIMMILFACIFIFPVILVVMNSLKPGADIILDPLSLPKGFAVENFIETWKTTEFPVTILNTFIITFFSTTGIIIVSSMAAYILARTAGRFSWFLYALFAFSLVIPFQTIMVPLNRMAIDYNLTNIWGIIPMYIGLGCPMAIFLYHGFIRSVPMALEESASIDGASRWQIFYRIVFPLLSPITATVAILDVLWIWNDFLLPLIIIKKGTIQLATYLFIGQFRQEYGLACAALVLSATPVIVFYIALQKYIVKGISAGAVKA
jgi:raffinose/stachyose/melibiose transport system permease protein